MKKRLKEGVGVGVCLGMAWGVWISYQVLAYQINTRCLAQWSGACFLVCLAVVLFTAEFFLPAALGSSVAIGLLSRLFSKKDADARPAVAGLTVALLAAIELLPLAAARPIYPKRLIPIAGLIVAAGLVGAGAGCIVYFASRSRRKDALASSSSTLLVLLFFLFPGAAWGLKFAADPGVSRGGKLGSVAAVGAAVLVCWLLLSKWVTARPRLRPLLIGLVAVAAVVGTIGLSLRGMGPIATDASAGPGKPNVVLIVIDSLRADALGAYGSAKATPNIDRLARESVVFEYAFSVAPWTLPSMASLFTGLYPGVHGTGVEFTQLDRQPTTLAEHFRNAGYATLAVLNQRLFSTAASGFDRGFEDVCSVECRPLSLLKQVPAADRLIRSGRPLDGLDPSPTRQVARSAIRGIERARQPFFLWTHWFDPHAPYDPPADRTPIETEKKVFNTSGSWLRLKLIDREVFFRLFRGHYFVSQDLLDAVKALYLAELQEVDVQVGKLIAALKEKGLYDGTIIVLLSDHGEEFWEREKWDHGHSVHQEILHIPLLVKIPGAAPTRIATRVTNLDILPTLLDLAGLSYDPRSIQGESLVPLIRGARGADRTFMAESCLYYQEQKAVYRNNLKAIWYSFRRPPELYDLERDPGEEHDLAAERPRALSELKELLDRMTASNLVLRRKLLGEGARSSGPVNPATLDQLKAIGYAQ